jgi:hypothetical protein
MADSAQRAELSRAPAHSCLHQTVCAASGNQTCSAATCMADCSAPQPTQVTLHEPLQLAGCSLPCNLQGARCERGKLHDAQTGGPAAAGDDAAQAAALQAPEVQPPAERYQKERSLDDVTQTFSLLPRRWPQRRAGFDFFAQSHEKGVQQVPGSAGADSGDEGVASGLAAAHDDGDSDSEASDYSGSGEGGEDAEAADAEDNSDTDQSSDDEEDAPACRTRATKPAKLTRVQLTYRERILAFQVRLSRSSCPAVACGRGARFSKTSSPCPAAP